MDSILQGQGGLGRKH